MILGRFRSEGGREGGREGGSVGGCICNCEYNFYVRVFGEGSSGFPGHGGRDEKGGTQQSS